MKNIFSFFKRNKADKKSDKRIITKLKIKDGDTLLLYGKWDNFEIDKFASELHNKELSNVLLIVIGEDPEKTIINIPDNVMKRHGWIRNKECNNE